MDAKIEYSEKWVVLIGIDFYIDPDRRLEGCVNDMEDVKLYLERNHSPLHVTEFLAVNANDLSQTKPLGPEASWPTYDNITGKLKQITALASPGAFVYVHYSGHGTSSPTTAEYKENFGSDSALVLYDTEKGVRYLRGIELASLFDDMVSKGLKLTIVLDCCRSGAVSRKSKAAYVRIRGLPWDDDTASSFPIGGSGSSFLKETTGRGARDASTNQHWLLRPREYTLVAACGPDEIAGECKGRDGRIHGALSYFLIEALTSASNNGHEITYRSLYRHICAKFHIPLPQQHPILLGNDTVGFMGAIDKKRGVKATCNITKAVDGRLWLDVGRAHGVGLGDDYSVYATELLSDEAPGTPRIGTKAKIKAVHALHSEAEQVQPLPEGKIVKAGWQATLHTPFRAKTQVRLYPGANLELRDAMSRSVWLEIGSESDSINVASIAVSSFGIDINEKGEYIILDRAHNQVANLPVVSAATTEAVHRVVTILEHLTMFTNIEDLENLSGDSLLEPDFSIEMEVKNDPNKQLNGNRLQVNENGKVLVTFKNNTDRPLNLTVFDMGPLRGVSKLYPSADRGDWKVVLPKQSKDGIDFPGQISFPVKMTVPDSIKDEGQSQIEDVLKFFVTTRPTSFATLELQALSEQVLGQKQRSNHKLFSFLRSLNAVLRNDTGKPGEKWACRNFTIHTTTTLETSGQA